ncbi:MAG: hypothetical protein WA704_19000 [Pseudolabrys sp.]
MKAPDDRPEIELSVMTAFSAGSASRSALMAGSGPMPQPKQGNPTVSETPAASSFRTSRRELSPHNLSAFTDCNVFDFAINLGSSRSSLAGIKTPLGVRLSKWNVHDQRTASGWVQPFASQLRCRLGTLPIVQADDVAIATKLD